jgi:hypothetical protein
MRGNTCIPVTTRILSFCLLVLFASAGLAEDQYELPPIEYSHSVPNNRVTKLQSAIEAMPASLKHEQRYGYLRDLLKSLEIPIDTQMLVFSKTSMQRTRISPRTPRAIYFNDDCYVGYCNAGDVIEIAVADPKLGAVFYTLDQKNEDKPVITRKTDSCLQCHGGSRMDSVPSFLVRSLFVDKHGQPILSEGSHQVDHTTPLENRWGGWYVSGKSGTQPHLGNLIIENEDAPRPWKNIDGQNVTDLSDRFNVKNYLAPHSDIVALLVFEHQAYVHNLITNATYTTQQALQYEREFNKALGEPESNRLESTQHRIESAGDKLLEGLLMADEAALNGPIEGTSTFAAEFAERGPHDEQGRSLRDLDLTSRLFKYPCSYLIYSSDFDAMPEEMKNYIKTRLGEILSGQGGDKFAHLSQDDRDSIRVIIKATKPGLIATDE